MTDAVGTSGAGPHVSSPPQTCNAGEERLLTVPVTEIQAFLSSFKPNRPSPNDLLVPTDKNR
eukprot:scaffold98667_cov19-Tisochrysis_lutea.AAC.2